VERPAPDIRAIFDQALEIDSPDERAAFLAAACADAPDARQRVEGLLRAHAGAGSFLQTPAPGLPTTVDHPGGEGPGSVVGPYKLLQQIGEGGMGTVFLAEQTHPVQRRVAVKIIKPGLHSRHLLARLEAERQALALMEHPNIARVLDAGTTDGDRPYFVMELVRGVPITKFCDERRLTPQERLRLFVPVCRAVQHAHQKGVIHRDLKPSNVLVATYDGKPVPKVIDFGIAKAIGQKLTGRTLFTEFGQVIGTPEYMSPEQAEANQLDVDTRSDVYSLGVLLYELLTGTTPLTRDRVHQVALLEVLRLIREEELPKPSTRLNTTKALTSIAANRGLDPRRLSGLVRGDLDWIVMKCLEKDRNRRYETANGLAEDIERHLGSEPVLARPPSVTYRLRKFVRRHKLATGLCAAGVVLVAGVIGGLLVTNRVVTTALYNETQAKNDLADALGRERDALARERYSLYVHRVGLAAQERAARRPGPAEELLDACPADLRGWEWHCLKRLRYGGPFVFGGHAARPLGWLALDPDSRRNVPVGWVAFSPDSQRIASVDADNVVLIWDAATGRVFHRVKIEHHAPRLVAFSPSGRHLAVWGAAGGKQTGGATVLDATGAEVFRFPYPSVTARRPAAFSPDGALVACAAAGGGVDLRETATGRVVRVFGRGSEFGTLAYSPDGKLVASVVRPLGGEGPNTVLKVWDAATGAEVFAATLTNAYCLAFSPDSRVLAAGDRNGTLVAWDVATKARLFETLVHNRDTDDVLFTPDGRYLVSSSGEGGVKARDLETGEDFDLSGHATGYVWVSLAVSTDSSRLVTTGLDRTVTVWDLRTRQRLVTFQEHAGVIYRAAFSPDGRRLATASHDGTVRVWDGTPLAERPGPVALMLAGHTGPVLGVAFDPAGRFLVSAGDDRKARVWDLRDLAPGAGGAGREVLAFGGHTREVRGVAISPDGQHVASVGGDCVLRTWEVATGRETARSPTQKHSIWDVTYSPDGTRIATAAGNGEVKVWNVANLTREELAFLLSQTDQRKTVAFSPDGRLLAAGNRQAGNVDVVKVWDLATREEVCTLRGPTGLVTKVVFSPDSRRIAASDAAGRSVRLWDIATRQELWPAVHHAEMVMTVAYSPDGRYLASGTSDGEVAVWEAQTGRKVASLFGPLGPIGGLAFRPDGRYLAATSGYRQRGEVTLWERSTWEGKVEQGVRF
jgi:WD40 repeat protein/serine/threonine protein kinase